MAVEVVAIGHDPLGQRARPQRRMLQRLIRDYPGPGAKQRGQCAGQPPGKLSSDPGVAAPDVGMRQDRFARQALQSARQRIAKVTQQQIGRIRPTARMGTHLPLEDEDLAAGQKLAQVIVGAAVAQAELEHRSWQICNLGNREAEAGTLRLEPPDEAVETTHIASLCKTPEDCDRRSKRQHRIGKPW